LHSARYEITGPFWWQPLRHFPAYDFDVMRRYHVERQLATPRARDNKPMAATLRLRSLIFPANSSPSPQPTAPWDTDSSAAEVMDSATGF
jgi:hypothetical protein